MDAQLSAAKEPATAGVTSQEIRSPDGRKTPVLASIFLENAEDERFHRLALGPETTATTARESRLSLSPDSTQFVNSLSHITGVVWEPKDSFKRRGPGKTPALAHQPVSNAISPVTI